jgi:ribosomal protein L37AE/L43A
MSQGVANAESEQPCELSQKSQVSQGGTTAAPTEPCPACGCRHYWRDGSAWKCESCNPPAADASRFLTVSGGKTAPMPPPALPWPPELSVALRRVSTAFEWSRADIADFTRWARRSPQALADAGEFLRGEAAKLPAP